jgi:hypothetical protein
MSMKDLRFYLLVLMAVSMNSCGEKQADPGNDHSIIFLHHSTGDNIWYGDKSTIKSKIQRKLGGGSAVKNWFKTYNRKNGTNYEIDELYFPAAGQSREYGNFPFDYYDIWVNQAGDQPAGADPTLEILSREYDMIIWKHCFPVGNILEDTGQPDIGSREKRVENYKLQYEALKQKMLEFPDTRFLVWTGAALLEVHTTEEKALRTREFFNWVRESWDEPGDNIYLWDFYELETGGGIYMKEEFAAGPEDAHPNYTFSGMAAILFCNRITDVIQDDGKKTKLTGELFSDNSSISVR